MGERLGSRDPHQLLPAGSDLSAEPARFGHLHRGLGRMVRNLVRDTVRRGQITRFGIDNGIKASDAWARSSVPVRGWSSVHRPVVATGSMANFESVTSYPTAEVLAPDGSLTGADPGIDPAIAGEMYRLMALSREFDRRMLALQRQGRIGTYPMLEGQEAVQIGSALALAESDFVFPSYREHGAK